MPIYEFLCNECGEIFEELRKIGDFSASPCPKCGSNKVEKKFSMFSGSGSGGGKSCGTCSTTPGSGG